MQTDNIRDRYPIGNPLVPYGTPLHITELFLRLLKMTFAEFPEDHPCHFNAEDFEKSGIAFDVALNKESGVYGKKPLVVVRRGTQQFSPTVIGDMAAAHIPSGNARGSNLYGASIEISVASRLKAEVEIIGQHIFSFMMLCRTHLPGLLGLHMVQSVMFSEVTKMEDDDAMFIGQGTMVYTGQYIWHQGRNDPMLRSVGVAIEKMKEPS